MHIQQIVHKNIFKNHKGLTFMELSIAILLLSIIATSATLFYTSLYETNGVSLTEERLKVVQKAINIYVLEKGHLPCPADPAVDVKSSGFGGENLSTPGDTDSECTGLSSDDIYFGAVPTKALNLSNKYALDGWGNKISYFVRLDFATDESTFTTTTYNSSTNLTINTNGTTGGTVVESNAIYALVSHGYNGRGAYTNSGGQIAFTTRAGEGVGEESYLSEDTNRYQSTFDETLVQDLYDENFDDFIVFKTKMSLIYDAGWEAIGCLGNEISNTEYSVNGTNITWTGSAITEIGDSLASDVDCSTPTGDWVSLNPNAGNDNKPERVCGPYGRWSNIIYECILGCVVNVDTPSYMAYIPAGSELYEECPTGESGEIIHTCTLEDEITYDTSLSTLSNCN